MGHMDVLDLVEREQLLLVAEHLLEEVYYKECPVKRILTFVNHFLRRHVVLDCTEKCH